MLLAKGGASKTGGLTMVGDGPPARGVASWSATLTLDPNLVPLRELSALANDCCRKLGSVGGRRGSGVFGRGSSRAKSSNIP